MTSGAKVNTFAVAKVSIVMIACAWCSRGAWCRALRGLGLTIIEHTHNIKQKEPRRAANVIYGCNIVIITSSLGVSGGFTINRLICRLLRLSKTACTAHGTIFDYLTATSLFWAKIDSCTRCTSHDHSSCALTTSNINVTGTCIVFSGLFGIKKPFPSVLAPKKMMSRLGNRK